MVLFPAVPGDQPAVFRQLYFSLSPIDGVQYTGFLHDDSDEVQLWIDVRLLQDSNSNNAVISAMSVAPTRVGYLTTDLRPGESISGASIGLATCIELIQPNAFPNVAFTGFVTSLDASSVTNVIHDVDSVPQKVQGALQSGIPLIIPSNAAKLFNVGMLYTPKDVLRGSAIDSTIGSALTVVEAIILAQKLSCIR